MRILYTKRPLKVRLTIRSMLVLVLAAIVVVPQVRPAAWSQESEVKNGAAEVRAEARRQADAVGKSSNKAGDVRQTLGTSKNADVVSRLDSLETEVRRLRDALASFLPGRGGTNSGPSLFYTVRRVNLTLSNRGDSVTVNNPLRNRGIGSKIKRIVADGAAVKKGDVLVEFDESVLVAELDAATVARERPGPSS